MNNGVLACCVSIFYWPGRFARRATYVNAVASSILALALLLLSAVQAEATEYQYDNLGRLVRATELDGSAIVYSYDANGNMLSIVRTGPQEPVAISSFSPLRGSAGSVVSVFGSGFDTVPANNTVTFGGVFAVVTSASANRLVVTVPAGAQTGAIVVASTAGSSTSSTAFVVTAVAIDSLSPRVGAAGNVVSIRGMGFDSTPVLNTVLFNGIAATVISASATLLQVTVPAGATSGRVSVNSSSGTALSASDFFIPPTGFAPADIAMIGRLSLGGGGLVYSLPIANRIGLALFDAQAGQKVTIVLTNVSMAGGSLRVYRPDGVQFYSTTIANNVAFDMAAFPVSGTYTVAFIPGSNVGSATIKIVPEMLGQFDTNGTTQSLSLSQGQNASLSVNAEAGRGYSFVLSSFTTTSGGGTLNITIHRPDGSVLTNCGSYAYNAAPRSCDFRPSVAGEYQVRIDPYGLITTNLTAYVVAETTGSISSGVPLQVSLARGQNAVYAFTVDSYGTYSMALTGVTTTPAGRSVVAKIHRADGSVRKDCGSFTATSGNCDFVAEAGMYTARLNLGDYAASFGLSLIRDQVGLLTINGPVDTFTTAAPGQNKKYTLSGTAGQRVSITYSGNSLTRGAIFLYRSNWSVVASSSNFSGVRNGTLTATLPVTGDYMLFVYADGAVTGSVNVRATSP